MTTTYTKLTSVTTGTYSISNAYLALLKVILGKRYELQMAEWFEDFLQYLKKKNVVRANSNHWSCHNFSKTYRISPKVSVKFKAWVYQEEVRGVTCVLQGFTGNTKISVDEMHRLSEAQIVEEHLMKGDDGEDSDEQAG